MVPLTPREQALLDYFYKVATTPHVMAAGASMDVRKFKDAVLTCVAEDLPGVAKHVLRTAANRAEMPVRMATRGVAQTMFGGTMSPKTADHAAGVVESLVGDGFQAIGKFFDRLEQKGKEKRK